MRSVLDIGLDLVAARRALGVTQSELGRRVGVSQPQIARWEAVEYRTTSLERIEAVARALLQHDTTVDGTLLAAEAPALYGIASGTANRSPEKDVWNRLGVKPATVAAFCTRHGIVELGVFGSVLGPDFSPQSDVDVLVRFDPEARGTLGDIAVASEELSSLLGRDVDLLERSAVERSQNYLRRRRILGELRNLYAA
jgi:predicted nucleotidyltransferase